MKAVQKLLKDTLKQQPASLYFSKWKTNSPSLKKPRPNCSRVYILLFKFLLMPLFFNKATFLLFSNTGD